MIDAVARYLIGALIGAALGALLVWKWAAADAERTLINWERAALNQRAAELQRIHKINQETLNGLDRDRARLRARLAAGWRPTIPAASGVPADGIPGTSGEPAAPVAAGLPAAAGDAAAELATCRVERAQLIADGQETVLRCRALMGWVADVARN